MKIGKVNKKVEQDQRLRKTGMPTATKTEPGGGNGGDMGGASEAALPVPPAALASEVPAAVEVEPRIGTRVVKAHSEEKAADGTRHITQHAK